MKVNFSKFAAIPITARLAPTGQVKESPGNILLDTKTGKTKLMPGAYPYEDFKKAIDEMLEN